MYLPVTPKEKENITLVGRVFTVREVNWDYAPTCFVHLYGENLTDEDESKLYGVEWQNHTPCG